MNPAAISEPYSSMLGGTRPRLPSPTNAYAPMPAASASSSSQMPLETRGDRSVVADAAHGPLARSLPLRSLRICSTIAERLCRGRSR